VRKSLPDEDKSAFEEAVGSHRLTFAAVFRHATTFLERSSRRYVDLGGLFKTFKF
jgi:hypothetical protein